ncbi:CHAD domain-containing protein [Spongiibacter sp. KMU-158]|uniref:CHAD domain-containing protein n=1 Tax=Spongiibacter pelagi TaxID=2760804 RepID=A0A927C2Y4_9GAMM|nr:CHAD domain-containing protein [Spongiibacter pelagi]MBD2858656.1 CHAD domain-containing protein [Spongiibacter pelagi]
MSDPILDKIDPQLEYFLTRLREPQPLSDNEIHDFRVLCKQLRAYLQFYRGERSPEQIKSLDLQVRHLAQCFVSSRDGTVLAQNLIKLAGVDIEQQAALRPLIEKYQQQSAITAPAMSEVASKLQELRTSWWASLACDHDGFMLNGTLNCYKRARQLANKAIESREDEAYHLWRKWAKYWLYQLRFGMTTETKLSKKYLSKLNKLGNQLGEFNDDCVLEKALLEHQAELTPDIYALLIEKISGRKKKAKRQFRSEAELLFGKAGKKMKVSGILINKQH